MKNRNKRKQLIGLLGIISIMCFLLLCIILMIQHQNETNASDEYTFKKEGELSFVERNSNKVIGTFDIEIADDNYERTLGLMYRSAMDNNEGMLFIMEQEAVHSFWMKNVFICLDIIYVNNNCEIVKIYKNTQPLSKKPLPSVSQSKYIVEVIGGICDSLNIKEGDIAKFKKTGCN